MGNQEVNVSSVYQKIIGAESSIEAKTQFGEELHFIVATAQPDDADNPDRILKGVEDVSYPNIAEGEFIWAKAVSDDGIFSWVAT